jgi:hypothetical protein
MFAHCVSGRAVLASARCLSTRYLFYFQSISHGAVGAELQDLTRISSKQAEALMRFVKAAGHRFGITAELFSFFWGHKRWWMLPMLVTLFLFGALLILAQSSAIAPFIYTLF